MGTRKEREIIKPLAIIPARSGSKAIVDKNIRDFCGKPLLAHTIEQAIESQVFSSVHVSTESEKYAALARDFGADTSFLRPVELAGDGIPTSKATLFVLEEFKKRGQEFDSFAVLQTTTPLRNIQDIQNAYTMLIDKKADVIISVSETYNSPLLCNTLDEHKSLKDFIKAEIREKPRQSLARYYAIKGAIFFARTSKYIENPDPYQLNSFAYIMPKIRTVDIDTLDDFYLAEFYFHKLHSD